MFCTHCGGQVDDKASICIHCGCLVTPLASAAPVSPKEEDGPSTAYAVIGFLIPLAGLILFLVNERKYPRKAKSAGKGALWGFLAGVALSILSLIFSYVFMFAILGGIASLL